MVTSRAVHKFERVTITLVPTADERSFRHIPTTFSSTERTYGWRHFEKFDYMMVPRKISSKEIKVDMFFGSQLRGKGSVAQTQKNILDFVSAKIRTDWPGLRLAGISRVSAAIPPGHVYRRGTIEEILGAHLEH